MAKYKIRFSGFSYIEAANEQEAVEAWCAGDDVYSECDWDEIEEVSEFPAEV